MRKLTMGLFFIDFALTSNPVYSTDMQAYGKIWTAARPGCSSAERLT